MVAPLLADNQALPVAPVHLRGGDGRKVACEHVPKRKMAANKNKISRIAGGEAVELLVVMPFVTFVAMPFATSSFVLLLGIRVASMCGFTSRTAACGIEGRQNTGIC